MFSGRLRIESNGSNTSRLSAEDLLACATKQNGCGGGVVQKVFQFWMGQGIVSAKLFLVATLQITCLGMLYVLQIFMFH
jgi:hypothetical protein